MPTKKAKATNRPTPPEDVTDEALLEWDRVCAELDQLGRLNRVDRALLVTYSQTWATHQTAVKHVRQFGPIIKWPNGVPGPSPFYKVAQETAGLLRAMLADLGLTPKARGFDAAGKGEDEPAELEF